MNIYLLVHHRSINEDWHEAIRGVFSTPELAMEALPGEWVQRENGEWEQAQSASISRAYILEYEVDQKVEAIKL